jgi:hypothetical protein
MQKINIELSPDQYKELLRLIYAGGWVIDEPENIALNDAVQLIFSKAKDAGHEELIEFDENMHLYMPSTDFDEEIIEIIDDFEDECFWDHLCYRLSERDAVKNTGQDFNKTTLEEKKEILAPLTEKYFKEFEDNGLDNIIIS